MDVTVTWLAETGIVVPAQVAARRAAEGGAVVGGPAEEARRLRLRITENEMTLRCPRCQTIFLEFDGALL